VPCFPNASPAYHPLTQTRAAVDDDWLSVVTSLLNRATVAGSSVSPGRRRRASRRHSNRDGLLVQTNLEPHTHILLTVEHPDSILRIFGNSVLHGCISLGFARRRILLQLAFDNLSSLAKVALEIFRSGFVVDVADKNAAHFGLDDALTDVDMRSGGRRNVHWAL
jgi:hypothetical protein